MSSQLLLADFTEVLADYQSGRMVILIDAADRENEGDLAVAAEKVSAEQIAFMMNYARGLICVSIAEEQARALSLPLQAADNSSPFGTPFTISVDLAGQSGITAIERAAAMRRICAADAQVSEFVSPGHVFPLMAHPAGVLGRQGQTEGSFDLARLTGQRPAGVICEILNPDGSMCRGNDLALFARQHGLKVTSVQEIIKYRTEQEVLIRLTAEGPYQSSYGEFRSYVFEDDVGRKEHLALVYGRPEQAANEGVLTRLHSECLTGDVFGSRRCDCGEQLAQAARQIVKAGCGVIIYLRQEGRGIGLGNKLRAYELQDSGHDTVEANVKLGFPPDSRDYLAAAKILKLLGISRVRLLTNNPGKVQALIDFGLEVPQRLPLVVAPTAYSSFYLDTKREKLGHWL